MKDAIVAHRKGQPSASTDRGPASSPEGETAGDRQIYIDYAPCAVGPCGSCQVELIGSGPVGVALEPDGTRTWLCDACLERAAPPLGLAMELLQGVRMVGGFLERYPTAAKQPGRFRFSITLTLWDLAQTSCSGVGWRPRIEGGGVLGDLLERIVKSRTSGAPT